MNLLVGLRLFDHALPFGRPTLRRHGIAEGHARPLSSQPSQDAGQAGRLGFVRPWRNVERRDLPPVGQHEGQRRHHGAQPLHGERAVTPSPARGYRCRHSFAVPLRLAFLGEGLDPRLARLAAIETAKDLTLQRQPTRLDLRGGRQPR